MQEQTHSFAADLVHTILYVSVSDAVRVWQNGHIRLRSMTFKFESKHERANTFVCV